jgi:hypothetical protein
VDDGHGLAVTTLNDLVGHSGAIIGHSSAAFRSPQADATFVIVGNRSTDFTTPTMDTVLSSSRPCTPTSCAEHGTLWRPCPRQARGCSSMARASAFQAEYAGSIPVTRSTRRQPVDIVNDGGAASVWKTTQ